MPKSDQELIEACRRGEGQAWQMVLDEYERLVFSIPLNYGLSPQDAADITQLTFTMLMESLDRLRDDSNLAAWLATVARRHSWRVVRQRHRESPENDRDLAEKSELLVDSANPVQHIETLQWLDYGLNLLEKRCRQLLQALYFDQTEPSYAMIARRLEMRVGSIGPTRTRCLKKLRQLLEHKGNSS